MDPRSFIQDVKRVIIKVGTSVLTRDDGRIAVGRVGALCEQIKDLHLRGYETVLVTSGAVGIGRQRLASRLEANTRLGREKPQGEGAFLGKACAAIGQSALVCLYETYFSLLDVTSSQILVNENFFLAEDFRKELADTVNALIEARTLPIFNENDTMTVFRKPPEDSLFSDNDSLAGLLAKEFSADLLILLSDVEGLYSGPPKDPSSKLNHTYVKEEHEAKVAFGDKSNLGRGGMLAKVKAAVSAARAGIPVLIASGYASDSVIRALNGEEIGTVFHPNLMKKKKEASACGSCST